MKKLTYLLAGSAFAAASANAEIVLTEDLSVYGYIDAAYVSANDLENIDGSVAEFELGFAFAPVDSQWTAVAELSFDDQDSPAVNEYAFETVAITYSYSDELSFSVGNLLTYVGFETWDATGLYQFSYQGLGGASAYFGYAGYVFGASADYSTENYAAGVWIGETGDDLSYELFYQFTGVEGLTATAVFADDPAYEIINLWASYEIDAFTFAVEYTDVEDKTVIAGNDEFTHLMFMGYYSFGDAGITIRYTDGDVFGTDYSRYTISPSYAFSDNVLGLVEWSYDDVDGGGENTRLAAEILFTF